MIISSSTPLSNIKPATQAEMETGTEAALRSMSPLRVKQSLPAAASQAEMIAGTESAARTLSPLRVAQAIPSAMTNLVGLSIAAENAYVASFFGGLFYKTDPSIVAFIKTGNGTATTSQRLEIGVNNVIHVIASGTSITMPTLVAGTDYAIWVATDGTLSATDNHTTPPSSNGRKIGGFHYAPGGNAAAQSGGDTTPQINAYSFWDLKFRPSCSDPRGMTLVANSFWVDIYLTGADAITNGSSKYNVIIADYGNPPKVPLMFGGNGSDTYGSYTWYEAMELAASFGKWLPTQHEFMAATYGTTEASSVGSDPNNTILNSAFTSKWGVIQSTGVMWIWGRDRGGIYDTSGWTNNTEGRGSEFKAICSAILGGDWSNTIYAGSRCASWSNGPSITNSLQGSRFVCTHLLQM